MRTPNESQQGPISAQFPIHFPSLPRAISASYFGKTLLACGPCHFWRKESPALSPSLHFQAAYSFPSATCSPCFLKDWHNCSPRCPPTASITSNSVLLALTVPGRQEKATLPPMSDILPHPRRYTCSTANQCLGLRIVLLLYFQVKIKFGSASGSPPHPTASQTHPHPPTTASC